jgi:uncharacterized protein YjiS (DUF1127 family)
MFLIDVYAARERNYDVAQRRCKLLIPTCCWSKVRSVFVEWQRRVQSRFNLDRLSERDLADMGLTRLEIFDETQKPFWQE